VGQAKQDVLQSKVCNIKFDVKPKLMRLGALLLLLLKDNPSFNEIGVGAPNRRNNVSTGFTP
jgi:hypothetical protein